MAESRENYFLLLGLAPAERNDAVIRRAIDEKQQEWVRQRSKPGQLQTEAQRLLNLLPDIRRVLLDDRTAREEEAADARKILDERKKLSLKTLRQRIDFFKTLGTYTTENVNQLARELAPHVTENDIRKALAEADLVDLDSKPDDDGESTITGLDAVKASNIAADLKALGKKDLYDFLGVGQKTSLQALNAKAGAKNKELMTKGNTHEVNTAKRLVGLTLDVFTSDDMRQRYDYTRSVEKLNDFGNIVRSAIRGGMVSFDAFRELVRQAAGRNVSEELARNFILDFARKASIHIQPEPAGAPPEPLLICGSCGSCEPPAKNAENQHCSTCGAAFRLDCPNPECDERVLASAQACRHCGFRTGDAPLVQAAVRSIGKMARDNPDAASQALQEAMETYGNWPGLQELANEIAARRRDHEQSQHQKKQAQADLESKLAALIRDRKWEAAGRLLADGMRMLGADARSTAFEEQIARGLKAAAGLFETALAAEKTGDNEKAAQFVEKTLAACSDYELARQAIGRLPPQPPSNLKAAADGKTVRLTWSTPPGKRRIDYLIVRYSKRPSASPSQGHTVDSTDATVCEDRTASPGTPCYYAVHSQWLGVLSPAGAVAGPVLIREAVQGLAAHGGAGSIGLRWTRPPGCTHVRVERKTGAVPAPGTGDRTWHLAGNTLVDDGLANGRTYGYLVTPLYPDPLGSDTPIQGPEKSAVAVPRPPAPAIQDLKAVWSDGIPTLIWRPLPDCEVEFLIVPQGHEPKPGAVLAMSEAADMGDILPGGSTGHRKVEFERQGLFSIVPLTVRAQTATAGRAVPLNTLSGVQNLRAQPHGSRIALQWDWPEGFTGATVRVAKDGYENRPNGGDAEAHTPTKAQYDKQGFFDFYLAEPCHLFITVFGRTAAGVYAPPARITCGFRLETRLEYRIDAKTTLSGISLSLILKTSGKADVPALVVVAKRGSLPEKKADGKIVATLSRRKLEANKEISVPIGREHCDPNGFARLFFDSDTAETSHVRLMTPNKNNLRLG